MKNHTTTRYLANSALNESKMRYLFALINLVLLFPFAKFAWHRFHYIQDSFSEQGIEFGIHGVFIVMKHNVLTLLLGFLSFIGILFYSQKRTFFFISTFYASTQLVDLIMIPSFSFWYIILVMSLITFLWFLIWNNIFLSFENRKGLKFVFLLSFVIVYLVLGEISNFTLR